MTARCGRACFCVADILVAEREAVVVPVTAVGGTDGKAVVMRVLGDTVEETPVETGIRESGFVEILSGLSPGDLVVTKAGAFVRDGDKINPVPDTRAHELRRMR